MSDDLKERLRANHLDECYEAINRIGALEAALATARREALEDAAKVAFTASTSTAPATERKKIATAIRALAAQEGEG